MRHKTSLPGLLYHHHHGQNVREPHKQISPEQAVNGGGSTVDAPQDVTGFASQVPAQREGVQVGEQAHLNYAVGVLLHPDPHERAHVADKS